MNRALVVLPLAAVLVAAALPSSRAQQASAPAVCDQLTPSRLLENPALAEEYASALRSGDASEIARVRAMFDQIRSAHGCSGPAAAPDAAPAPRLPPGHPPITPGERPPVAVGFEGPGTVTI
ncbi:MAG TPA: hypothetical protein VF841_03240 [Anaeromyxobacter sp.]